MKFSLKANTIALTAASFFALAASANASDLLDSMNDPAPAQAKVNWTGLWVGAVGGGTWANSDFSGRVDDWGTDPKFIGPHDYDPSGFLLGGTLTYNHQIGNIVAGVEGELGYMKFDDAGSIPSSTPAYHQELSFNDGMYAVLGGRLGFAFGRSMIYGKGGWAYFDGAASQETTKPGFTTHDSDPFTGWAYGGGVEFLLADNVSLKVEYLRFDFGEQTGNQTSDVTGHVFEYDTDLTMDTIKAGLNYRF